MSMAISAPEIPQSLSVGELAFEHNGQAETIRQDLSDSGSQLRNRIGNGLIVNIDEKRVEITAFVANTDAATPGDLAQKIYDALNDNGFIQKWQALGCPIENPANH